MRRGKGECRPAGVSEASGCVGEHSQRGCVGRSGVAELHSFDCSVTHLLTVVFEVHLKELKRRANRAHAHCGISP